MRNSIIIITVSLLVAACASMKVLVTPGVDLRQFSRVHLQKSATTYPQLHLSIIKELEKIGLEMVDGQSFSPNRNDLLVEYLCLSMRVPDNDGDVQLLPKVLELRFYSSRDNVMLANGRFEYISGEITTEQVVSDLFAKIDNPKSKQGVIDRLEFLKVGATKELPKESDRLPLISPEAISLESPGTEEKEVQVPTTRSTKTAVNQGSINTLIDRKSTTDTKQASQPPAASSISTKTTSQESSAPELKESLQPEWLPRLQSWGFENWGNEEIPD